jgi:hypothetical protein
METVILKHRFEPSVNHYEVRPSFGLQIPLVTVKGYVLKGAMSCRCNRRRIEVQKL